MSEIPHPVDVHVGQRLRLRRALMGLSQERLAELVGVTFQQIQKYERGANRIGSSRLYELSRVLAVPIDYFFEGLEETERSAPGLAEPAAGFRHETETRPEPRIIDRRETLELVRAFNRIADPLVRRRLFDLAKALAEVPYRETAGAEPPT